MEDDIHEITLCSGVELTPIQSGELLMIAQGVAWDRFERTLRAFCQKYATSGNLRFWNRSLFLSLLQDFEPSPLSSCTYGDPSEVRRKFRLSRKPKSRWFGWFL